MLHSPTKWILLINYFRGIILHQIIDKLLPAVRAEIDRKSLAETVFFAAKTRLLQQMQGHIHGLRAPFVGIDLGRLDGAVHLSFISDLRFAEGHDDRWRVAPMSLAPSAGSGLVGTVFQSVTRARVTALARVDDKAAVLASIRR